jgi:hypothetical protein
MATVKKAIKAQNGKTIPVKKGSFEDVMGKTLNETDVFSKNFKKSTPAEEAKAAKQAAEMKKKSAAGKAFKNGGSLTGLKASTKRVGSVDPKGAYTKVQKKTLAGAKGKASLKKDKQLGATKMKTGGNMMGKCKYGCK